MDCRRAAATKEGERMSGTQIWMGRKPCCRNRLRCVLTLSREDLDRLRVPMANSVELRSWLHVTYHNGPPISTADGASLTFSVLTVDGSGGNELAGGEVIEGAEAAGELVGAQAAVAVERTYKLDGVAVGLQ